jgi:hypothetical protein
MPNFDTRVERELREQGRLKESPGCLDYDFNTQSLNDLYTTVMMCFGHWIIEAHGLANISKWVRNYFLVHDHCGTSDPGMEKRKQRFRETVADSNKFMLDTLSELFRLFETEEYLKDGKGLIDRIRSDTGRRHEYWCREVKECMYTG